MRIVGTLALSALFLAGLGTVRAADQVELKVGDPAPKFKATDDAGNEWKSSEHIGKKIVVVYFFPADFTGGCTKQACAFRDNGKALEDKGVEVIAISGDSAKNHELFKKHHKLTFTLLADEEGTIAKKFGVPVNKGGEVTVKELDGLKLKRGVTISRWTFVIGKDGKVLSKNTKVSAPDDPKNVLEIIEKEGK